MNGNKGYKDEQFALPKGVDWTPVDKALKQLEELFGAVVESEQISVKNSLGRVLSEQIYALKAHPPYSNSAVDGYGISGPIMEGEKKFQLIEGVIAPGRLYEGQINKNQAVKILTGAALPRGVNAVLLAEDTQIEKQRVTFQGPVSVGLNTRGKGEDILAGALLFSKGFVLRPQDIAVLISSGISRVRCYKKLKIGILSTGNEIIDIDEVKDIVFEQEMIYDSNLPMLSALIKTWNLDFVDLGSVPDDLTILERKLDVATSAVDVVITSGGASGGDHDNISRALRSKGVLSCWRIAVKPGRPLAFGLWNGTPLFGLPGNPVAAFVCMLIFVLPALRLLAGSGWKTPPHYMVAADFQKKKKGGRREYLRARLNEDGTAECFHSEGSGRVSGLSWSEGLIELPDAKCLVKVGDRVKYLPYNSFVF